jgi:two-component system NarL family response regulator
MAQQKIISVMIVEDQAIIREGISLLLETQADLHVVAEAASGEQAIELYQKHRPDITLMDLRLPGISGSEAIARIRRDHPAARFIVLTTYEGDEDIHSALRAGAKGYLLKGMSRDELLSAIRAVHAGQRRIPESVAVRLSEHVGHEELSAREMEVLRLIVDGLSNKEIAARLEISEFTVKFHVKGVLGKLEVRDRSQAITAALQRGIIHL